MNKWQISDAAVKRIEKRIIEAWTNGGVKSAETMLHEALASEDFGPRRGVRDFIGIWIREGSETFRSFAAMYFESLWHRHETMMEAVDCMCCGMGQIGIIPEAGDER